MAIALPHWMTSPLPSNTPKDSLLNLLFALRFRLPRRFPPGLRPFAGSHWWCLSQQHAKYVVDFVASHPGVPAYFRYTYQPDEMFIYTVLMSTKDQQIVQAVMNDQLAYVDWSKPRPP